ncbi:MAG: alpha/beta hydrolase [Acidobacteria bacterium]|nr:alpha/beta hydrolase [Acidobacteriota bacterium]
MMNLIRRMTTAWLMLWSLPALCEQEKGVRQLAADLQAVQVDGQRIDYYDIGKGRPVMLIHGAQCDAADWRDVIPALIKRYRLIIPDGLVYPIDEWRLWLLLDHLAIEQVAIVGHSKGGNKAKEMYRLRPNRVAALVVMDDEGVGGMVEASELPNSLCSPHVLEMHRKNDKELAKFSPPLLENYPSEKNIARLRLYFTTAAQTSEQRSKGRPNTAVHPMKQPLAPKPRPIDETDRFIKCPLLVFNAGYGKVDASNPPEKTRGWNGKPIQADRYKFVVVRDSGHWIWLDQPQIFLKELLNFLGRSYPERR